MNPQPLSMVVVPCLAWKHQILTFASVLDYGSSLVAQTVKNLSAVQETQVRSLCQEDPLEEETATHSSLLACGIPWTEEPVGYSPSVTELDVT